MSNMFDGSLLDMEDYESFPSLLHYSADHKSSITGLLTTSGSSTLVLVSSSLDGSCKVTKFFFGTITKIIFAYACKL